MFKVRFLYLQFSTSARVYLITLIRRSIDSVLLNSVTFFKHLTLLTVSISVAPSMHLGEPKQPSFNILNQGRKSKMICLSTRFDLIWLILTKFRLKRLKPRVWMQILLQTAKICKRLQKFIKDLKRLQKATKDSNVLQKTTLGHKDCKGLQKTTNV